MGLTEMSVVARPILHVDMDAFFAAIEQRDRPELRGRPVVVGSPPDRRGVVSTCSYEARRYGIHSAMPSRTAYQLCPQAVFLPVRGSVYAEVSRQLMELFLGITPQVEQVSIDEAFLDVRGACGECGDSLVVARELKERIRLRLRLTASVGVASNKFLAKLASDLQKPDGLTVVPVEAEQIVAFLAPLPVRRIWGVGAKTAERLAQFGIRTIGDVQKLSETTLGHLVGVNFARHLGRLARGIDNRPLVTEREEKSISNEETFEQDCTDAGVVRQTLLELTEKVGRRLRQAGKRAGSGQIKVRFEDFTTVTRQMTFAIPTASDRELLQGALELYSRLQVRRPVRLIGFGVGSLEDGSGPAIRQPSLFAEFGDDQRIAREEALDRAVDALRQQYGVAVLRRGDWGGGPAW